MIEIKAWGFAFFLFGYALVAIYVNILYEHTFEEPKYDKYIPLMMLASTIWPIGLAYYILWGLCNIVKDMREDSREQNK